jgi:NAD(P)-dependent dehydrogenase (short-subunit alcohol dehydrogenase family)
VGTLSGKVAIVTGGGRGVGRGEALALAAEGACVVVNDLGGTSAGHGRSRTPATEVVGLIERRGGRAVPNYQDVGTFAGAREVVRQAVGHFGHLDILVNNAGISRDCLIHEMTEEQFESVIRVNLKGSFNVMRHAASYWHEETLASRCRNASIINTVSVAGLEGSPGQVNYGAAKAGVAAMTLTAAVELAEMNVRCNAISPTGFTRLAQKFFEGPGGEHFRRTSVSTGDAHVHNPEENDASDSADTSSSASLVVWLASDESSHVTGQVFRVHGDGRIVQYGPWRPMRTVSKNGKWTSGEISVALGPAVFSSTSAGEI